MNIKGIDVSKWQGEIDWPKVKSAGINFAMIRIGYGGPDGDCALDPLFKANVEGALAAGVDVGCYIYSYAQSVAAAKREAEFAVKQAEQYKGRILYPIAFDVEDASQTALGKSTLTAMADAACSVIEAAGWYASIYCNKNWATNYLDMTALAKYDLWLAQWANAPTYTGHTFNMWQYSSKGRVPGISGNVDLDIAYMDFPSVIKKKGLNGCTVIPTAPKKTIDQLAAEVLAGTWGNGTDRKNRLTAAGYDYDAVQAAVNAKLGTPAAPAKKSIDEIAAEVIAGKWGNGADRKTKLEAAGYNYTEVQNAVNKKLGTSTKKSNTEIAKEVIAGKWGNGTARRNKLTAAGYDYDAIQKIVNTMI